jgi:hypothetical protein
MKRKKPELRPSSVKGFMCYIDYAYELGNASGGNKVYPSMEDLYKSHPMADDCGVVEVEVVVKSIVVQPKH